MSEPITNPAAEAVVRIAQARAGRVPVDSNGTPTGPSSSYTYDATGRLVSVTPDDQAKP